MWNILIIIMFILSIYMSFKIKFDNYKFKLDRNIDKSSLFMSLGTKMGVGSIIGVASSYIIGGVSSVIWMCIFAIFTSSLIYIESYYGKKYSKNKIGGPYYILRNGLNKKKLSIISLILLIITYSFLFQMIQINTITSILTNIYQINIKVIIVIVSIFIIISLFLSIKDIIYTMNKIVPFMCLLFIIISIYCIINNINILVINIGKINFNIHSFLSGMIIGIKKSIFSNEVLVGTTSISSAVDDNDIRSSARLQVIGSYFITFIISILVLLVIIIYDGSEEYNMLICNSYLFSAGKIGLYIISIIIILFGITTILSGLYIGKSYIKNINNKYERLFNILFYIIIILGIILNNSILWNITDILLFIMIIINIYSIIKLLRNDNYD